MKNYTKKFWDILNLIEDYEKYGFKDTHSEVSFTEGAAGSKDEMLKTIREKEIGRASCRERV